MSVSLKTAMIIDDDQDLGQVLATILENRKIPAMTVSSLSEAEECLTRLKPTVIFLDNSFPEGLGLNFIRHIKDTDGEIKIIMMTADNNDWIKAKAVEEGANYFLHKPFSTKLLDAALQELNLKSA
jgi:DNA-binding response OmpR family regulator